VPIFLSFFSIATLPVIIEYGYSGPLFPISVALTVVILYITGLWIGLLMSAYLKLRSQSSPKYRDLAKVVIIITTIIIGLAFFILSSSQTATLNTWYSPTTWTSNIIYYSVTGTNLTLIKYPGIFYYPVLLAPDVLTSLALLLTFLGVVFLMGVLLVRRIRKIDLIGEGIVTIKGEGKIYKYLRKIMPTKIGRLTVVQLKEFFRDPESLTRIITVFVFPIILYFLALTLSATKVGRFLLLAHREPSKQWVCHHPVNTPFPQGNGVYVGTLMGAASCLASLSPSQTLQLPTTIYIPYFQINFLAIHPHD